METQFLNQIAVRNFTEGARDADLQQDAIDLNDVTCGCQQRAARTFH